MSTNNTKKYNTYHIMSITFISLLLILTIIIGHSTYINKITQNKIQIELSNQKNIIFKNITKITENLNQNKNSYNIIKKLLYNLTYNIQINNIKIANIYNTLQYIKHNSHIIKQSTNDILIEIEWLLRFADIYYSTLNNAHETSILLNRVEHKLMSMNKLNLTELSKKIQNIYEKIKLSNKSNHDNIWSIVNNLIDSLPNLIYYNINYKNNTLLKDIFPTFKKNYKSHTISNIFKDITNDVYNLVIINRNISYKNIRTISLPPQNLFLQIYFLLEEIKLATINNNKEIYNKSIINIENILSTYFPLHISKFHKFEIKLNSLKKSFIQHPDIGIKNIIKTIISLQQNR
ncbi:MAG: uroporphyrinogen-III C-methyltransferase [Candidatus Azosocius agrarius]|nr:MAG: uroporphyrinogen-III C-methyltransferase [Gammaproteobacteria bacterium]